MEAERIYTCDSCVQAAQLKIKFVAHLGEVAFQKVKRYKELAGVDVILVHRLLKNSVPVSEYVLMSEPIFSRTPDDLRKWGKETRESLEGLGDVTTYYIDLTELARDLPAPLQPSKAQKIWAWVKMTWRSIPYFLGIRKSCEGFRNLGDMDPSLAPPPSAALPPPS